ncbi:ATP-dependent DNA helicase RecG [bacterium]|nr:MAG: ATP-dependent DNA helicase RecG [bacterium]
MAADRGHRPHPGRRLVRGVAAACASAGAAGAGAGRAARVVCACGGTAPQANPLGGATAGSEHEPVAEGLRLSTLILPQSLDAAVSALPKVKPADAKRLTRLGLVTIRDLLLALPFGWEAYGEPAAVANLTSGQQATVIGTIAAIGAKRTPRRGLRLTEATLRDDSGDGLKIVWFNQPYLARQLQKGDRVAVAGTVRQARYGAMLEMQNPHHERLEGADVAPSPRIGGLMPKYHLVAGLSSRKVAGWVEAALPLADQLEDVLPATVREHHHLLPVAAAVRWGHRPDTEEQWRDARRRMAFAELFELQAAFALMRASIEAEPATSIPYRQDVIDAFKAGLGFELTRAQRRSTWEAFQDMERTAPMNRLLNGDVGSGKTAVAAACAAMAHAAGLQAVVMAPTEILARQHLHRFRAYLEETFPSLTVELLVSSQGAAERRRVRSAAASGHCALVVGTHALIEDEVEFAALGLAVVDEQHRFGTRQRELLRSKGRGRPHFLAMTATPIPRTLALALYGEMVVSVIDEQPPGRTPVETEVVAPEHRQRAYDLVRAEVRSGRQAFVICPLIEESELLSARSATAEFERLKRDVFPDLRLGLVHGRMRDKDEAMQGFVSGETQVLVATAVVEVGVDVPNATVMMIEGAERFGLAQLHQFRGRVGRGANQSHCLLLTDDPSAGNLDRLHLVAGIQDGFALAREDMNRRGVGQLMGPRQHGMSDAAMEALQRPELLSEVREEVEQLMLTDPGFDRHPVLKAAAQHRQDQISIS